MNLSIFTKQKLTRLLFITAGVLFIGGMAFWFDMTQVSAQILPVVVNVNHLDFGTVFPGEEQQGTFTVSYTGEVNGVSYSIIKQRKPLPPDDPEYPDGGDPDMPGYYRDLCPFLQELSVDQEGDTENLAFVGVNDPSDLWTVYFKVPAIFGHVGQNHIGGVVDSEGTYGCDISIDVLSN